MPSPCPQGAGFLVGETATETSREIPGYKTSIHFGPDTLLDAVQIKPRSSIPCSAYSALLVLWEDVF